MAGRVCVHSCGQQKSSKRMADLWIYRSIGWKFNPVSARTGSTSPGCSRYVASHISKNLQGKKI